jgi:hypothetical protein
MAAFMGITVSGAAGCIGGAVDTTAEGVELADPAADDAGADDAVAEEDPTFGGADSPLPPPHANATNPEVASAPTKTH